VSAAKDPQVHHPGRPDPGGEAKDQPAEPSRERQEPGPTEAEQAEAEEPKENRFPGADEHQESG
jgi:hypothetical protein